jgi:hypothetical protein
MCFKGMRPEINRVWSVRVTSRWRAFGYVHPGHLSCSFHLDEPDDTCYWCLLSLSLSLSQSLSLSLSLSLTPTPARTHAHTHTHTHTHKHRRCRILSLLVRPDIIFIRRIYCLYLFAGLFFSNLSVIYKLLSKYFVFYDLQTTFLIYYIEMFIICVQTKFLVHTYKQYV